MAEDASDIRKAISAVRKLESNYKNDSLILKS